MKRLNLFSAMVASVFTWASSVALTEVFANTMPPTIHIGSSGSYVVELQRDLKRLGFAVGSADGQFGAITLHALQLFQIHVHLPVTGIANDTTWQALFKSLTAIKKPAGPPGVPHPSVPGPGSVPVSNLRKTTIALNGKTISTPYAFTLHHTTYMPIWYLMHALSTMGMQSRWDGSVWSLTIPASMSVDTAHVHLGPGRQRITFNGKVVSRLTGVAYQDVYTHQLTEYMPIWYLQRALLRLGMQYQWNGERWLITAKAAPTPKPPAPKPPTPQPPTSKPPAVTYTVYMPSGTTMGPYTTLVEAKSAIATNPGAVVVDAHNAWQSTQPIPYVGYSAAGSILNFYPDLQMAQQAVQGMPGAVVKDAAGMVVIQSISQTSVYRAYGPDGVLIGGYSQLSQAEQTLLGYPGGTVQNAAGQVIFTEPATVTVAVYAQTGALLNQYASIVDATAAATAMPGSRVVDSSGNVLYMQPLNPTYLDEASSGALLGIYSTLTVAEQALVNNPGGFVVNRGGNVLFIEKAGGSQSGATGSGPTPPPASDFANVDLRFPAPANVTSGTINQYLLTHNSPLAGLGQVFVTAQTTYGVDANYLVSHAILESSWGKSQIALVKNNIYGYGAYDSNPGVAAGRFPSLEYAILYQAWSIRQNYLTPGAGLYVSPTLKGMNVHYATDPNWASSISALMGELAGSVGDGVGSYPAYTATNVAPVPPSSTEPTYRLNGASGIVQSTPNYGSLPYYSNWVQGNQQMFTRTLSMGDSGGDVATLQAALNQADRAGLTVDGDYGPMTKAAVTAYQTGHGLSPNGVCNYALWSRVVSAPTEQVAAGQAVSIDAIAQGLAGGYVTEWYHIAHAGWVDSQFVHLTNVYRLTVPSPTSPADTLVSVYAPGNAGSAGNTDTVETSVHAGDFVVAQSAAANAGYLQIQLTNQATGQPLRGEVNASQVSLTQIQ